MSKFKEALKELAKLKTLPGEETEDDKLKKSKEKAKEAVKPIPKPSL